MNEKVMQLNGMATASVRCSFAVFFVTYKNPDQTWCSVTIDGAVDSF